MTSPVILCIGPCIWWACLNPTLLASFRLRLGCWIRFPIPRTVIMIVLFLHIPSFTLESWVLVKNIYFSVGVGRQSLEWSWLCLRIFTFIFSFSNGRKMFFVFFSLFGFSPPAFLFIVEILSVFVICVGSLPLPMSNWVVCSASLSGRRMGDLPPVKSWVFLTLFLLTWEGDGYESVGLGNVLTVFQVTYIADM